MIKLNRIELVGSESGSDRCRGSGSGGRGDAKCDCSLRVQDLLDG